MDLSIGDVARRCGVSIEAIRYYEKEGLVPKPPRTSSGRRAYSPEHLQTISFVRRARDMGFSLRDTRELLASRDGAACHAVKDIARKHLADVKSRLRRLLELEAQLAKAIDGCPDGVAANCAILKALEGKCC